MGYGMEDRGTGGYFCLLTSVQTPFLPTKPTTQRLRGALDPSVKEMGVKEATRLHLKQTLRMLGAIPSVSHTT